MVRILVLDGSAINRETISKALKAPKIRNGLAAELQFDFYHDTESLAQSLGREETSVILTDLLPQDRDGLEFLSQLRQQHPSVPVVVLTSRANERLALQALRNGASSYVPIRLMHGELADTIQNVTVMASRQQSRNRVMDCLRASTAEFELINDRSLVAPLVTYLQNSAQEINLIGDATDRMRFGIAMEEALLNAIYHGNLEVDSALREEDDRAFYREIETRQHHAQYRDRRVYVGVSHNREEGRYVIRDQGLGFDLSKIPDPTDPENVGRVSGRGVLLMRAFMDEVTYNERGNEVILVKRAAAT